MCVLYQARHGLPAECTYVAQASHASLARYSSSHQVAVMHQGVKLKAMTKSCSYLTLLIKVLLGLYITESQSFRSVSSRVVQIFSYLQYGKGICCLHCNGQQIFLRPLGLLHRGGREPSSLGSCGFGYFETPLLLFLLALQSKPGPELRLWWW